MPATDSHLNEPILKKKDCVCLFNVLIECVLQYCGKAIALFMGQSSTSVQQTG